jgi:hypothetical protein
VNCWDTFNTTSCTWDNDTTQPAAPEKKLLGYFYFQHDFLGKTMMTAQPAAQK